MLTDQELQTLRNLGGLSEDAAIEIETLRAANFSLAAGTCVVQGGLLGDEGGTPYCTLKADAERLRLRVHQTHETLRKRQVQASAEYRSWQSPFRVRAASMFNVPVSEVTLAMYAAAAVERTQQDTVPPGEGGETASPPAAP